MRVLDVFLLHCLLQDSPPDTPEEIAALGRNQHRTAAYGRETALALESPAGGLRPLREWAFELLEQCLPIAAALDAAHGGNAFAEALGIVRAAVDAPQTLPSARVLAMMQRDFGGSHIGFVGAQAEQTRNHLLARPWSREQQAAFEAKARESIDRRRTIEAADEVDFETFRLAYLAPERLRV
jgi:glutamate--cysteine ligase